MAAIELEEMLAPAEGTELIEPVTPDEGDDWAPDGITDDPVDDETAEDCETGAADED